MTNAPGTKASPNNETDNSKQNGKDQKPKPPNKIISTFREYYYQTVLDPEGKVNIAWSFIAASAVAYNLWAIPLRCTFPYQTESNRGMWWFLDYLSDTIYLLDIILLQPRIKRIKNGNWVADYNSTRKDYLKQVDFKFDVLSLIPLDILYIYFGSDKVVLRLPRFFKVHTFFAFCSLIDTIIASPHIIRIVKTLLNMMYLIHMNACAYYGFSIWAGIGTNEFAYDGLNNAYIVCFYFATKTATSIGKTPAPVNDSEYIFMTYSWLMGVFVYAVLISQIRDIVATSTRVEQEYRRLVDETLEYMRSLNLPQEALRRVQSWFTYTWKTQHTLYENNTLNILPHKMKTDIAINVHIRTLSKVSLFSDCDETLLRELVLCLKSMIYLPGDLICKKGDVGKEMYILQSGRVQVMGSDDKEVIATLSEGCVFGEISLLGIPGMGRRTCDVKALGYSNLFVLNKNDLNAALTCYPEAQTLLNKKAQELIKINEEIERKKAEAMKLQQKQMAATTKKSNSITTEVIVHKSSS